MLIQDKEFNGGHGGHEQRHGLALAAGEDAYLDIHFILQAKAKGAQGFAVGFHPLPVGSRTEVKCLAFIISKGHVFQDCHGWAGAHGRILIDASDAALTLVFRHPGDVFPANDDLAVVQRDASADDIEHGSLARAIAAHHGDKLMVPDSKAEILEQAHFIDRTGIVVFIDVFQFKHGSLPSFPWRS